MHEEIIHFAWKYSYARFNGVELAPGEPIEVISPGIHNHHAGPDFFNAKVKVGNTIWAGNVEIHIKASDWNRHNHNANPAYDSVILHIVAMNDGEVYNSRGAKVPTIEIPYPDELEHEHQRLIERNSWIPCAHKLPQYDPFAMKIWLSALAVQRLEAKTEKVNRLVELMNGSWEEAFYISMAHSFGLKVNALPFELLAKSIPLKALAKIKDNLLSIEAILFGQAGLLPLDNPLDSYSEQLVQEYSYQKGKLGLHPVEEHLWKFLRLRPAAFPTIRIAQFAMLIHSSSGLFSKCLDTLQLADLYKLLGVSASDYWQNHYTFGHEAVQRKKRLGKGSMDVIILNSVVPFAFAYGKARGNEQLQDKALSLLEAMKPERNSIVDGFEKLGVKADSAFFTQALVQLKQEYCDPHKCLFCQVGTSVLLKKI